MAFKFEKLQIWNIAVDLANEVDLLAGAFPRREIFSLCNQIKRAADSVALNIAEGCTGQSNREFCRFLGIALRSAIEVVACLKIAQKRNYIEIERYHFLYNNYETLCKMISSLRKTL